MAVHQRIEVVACLGSSTTAGKRQAFDWIGALKQRPRNDRFRFLTFGVGGDLASNMRRRLPRVLAAKPSYVILLTGSNDILASVFQNVWRFFRLSKRLAEPPTPEAFEHNLSAIVRTLRAGTSAAIALASLPQVGESPNSTGSVQRQLNVLYARYSEIIKTIAGIERTAYLPVFERLHAEIVAAPGRAFTEFRFWPFTAIYSVGCSFARTATRLAR
ncbi:MAG TPA: SGNH/GDSL hydrolase family protein [Gemmatimonadales bacterium]|nr:SGNH/GDSL hydrolase family protein [Gemmatimonadales bacterium]